MEGLIRSVSQEARQCFADWLLRDLHLRGVKFGESSISVSPPAVGDVIRWSGTKAAVALGDLGMNVATGRPSAFVGGADSPLAILSEVGAVASSGSTTRAAGTGSGNQNVAHGLGRAAKVVLLLVTDDGAPTAVGSQGFCAVGGQQLCTAYNTVAFVTVDKSNVARAVTSIGDGYLATVSASDATNFTIAYVVQGAGRAITVQWVAIG